MRLAPLAAPFAALLLAAAAPGQGGPYLATVTDPEVRLRAGPSGAMPETDTVKRGAHVVVDHDEPGGWLAVKPLRGSVSWIPAQFLEGYDPDKPLPQNVSVRSEGEVTLAAGQVGVPQPLDIRRVKVPDGTILEAVGQPVAHQGKKWLPVTPPDGDFRYLPKTAVQAQRAANDTFTVVGATAAKPNPTPAGTPVTAAAAETAAKPAAPPEPGPRPAGFTHPLWAKAEQAERDGRNDDAEKLYFELARAMNEPGGDHDAANQCYSRVHALREKKRLAGASPANWAPSTRDDRPITWSRPDDRGPPASRADFPPPADPRDNDPANRGSWAGAGTLVKSALTIDGRRAYALESAPGVVRLYVSPAPAVDLDRHLNRRVNLYGTTATRRDLSKPLLTATSVDANP